MLFHRCFDVGRRFCIIVVERLNSDAILSGGSKLVNSTLMHKVEMLPGIEWFV